MPKIESDEDAATFQRIRTQPHQRREGIKIKRQATKKIKAKKHAYRQHTVALFASPLWKRLRRLVLRAYGHECMRCHHLGSRANPLTVDHIRPRCRDLESEVTFANLQVLCWRCNEWKGENTIDFRPRPLTAEAAHCIALQQTHSIEQLLALARV